MEILAEIRACKEKAIVFSYFLEPLNILGRRVRNEFGATTFAMLLGKQDAEERSRVVQDFCTSSSTQFLLASTRVGGEGLTLTEANHVIFFNEWWNPSSNDQAKDRVVRIGQNRGVTVYTFVCKGTIEELLCDIIRDKRATFETVIDSLAQEKAYDEEEQNGLIRAVTESLADYQP